MPTDQREAQRIERDLFAEAPRHLAELVPIIVVLALLVMTAGCGMNKGNADPSDMFQRYERWSK